MQIDGYTMILDAKLKELATYNKGAYSQYKKENPDKLLPKDYYEQFNLSQPYKGAPIWTAP